MEYNHPQPALDAPTFAPGTFVYSTLHKCYCTVIRMDSARWVVLADAATGKQLPDHAHATQVYAEPNW